MPDPKALNANRPPSGFHPHLWASALFVAMALLTFFLIVPFVEQANQIAALKKDDVEVTREMLHKSDLVLKFAGRLLGNAPVLLVSKAVVPGSLRNVRCGLDTANSRKTST